MIIPDLERNPEHLVGNGTEGDTMSCMALDTGTDTDAGAIFVAAVRRHRRLIRNAVRAVHNTRKLNASDPKWILEMDDRQWGAVMRRLRRS